MERGTEGGRRGSEEAPGIIKSRLEPCSNRLGVDSVFFFFSCGKRQLINMYIVLKLTLMQKKKNAHY